MNILDQIVYRKYQEVKQRRANYSGPDLEKSNFFRRKTVSLRDAIMTEGSSGIIAEFKRRSPSRGIINESASAGKVCTGYSAAGSSAVSVLTDQEFFGGSMDDLAEVRSLVNCPVLCKDFIIDEYQVIEARSAGADAILLISDILPTDRLDKLFRFALSLGLEALIEVHNKKYYSSIPHDASLIGINSRDLSTFNVSLGHSLELADILPGNVVKVAESGIKTIDDYLTLKKAGFNGFLIGESFMNSGNPAKSCKSFIESVRRSQEPSGK
jgi:indole-3-glycerol phosphate synthase